MQCKNVTEGGTTKAILGEGYLVKFPPLLIVDGSSLPVLPEQTRICQLTLKNMFFAENSKENRFRLNIYKRLDFDQFNCRSCGGQHDFGERFCFHLGRKSIQ